MTRAVDPSFTLAPELASLAPAARARLIYQQARQDLELRLWHSALGEEPSDKDQAINMGQAPERMEDFLAALKSALACQEQPIAPPERARGAAMPASTALAGTEDASVGLSRQPPPCEPGGRLNLAANSCWQPAIERAAVRTGLPEASIAAIIDAEAGRTSRGQWTTSSRNPRSSAAGLGQFLAGTWIGEAERQGTWLNARCQANGALGADGRVRPEAKASVLALRYDGEAAIEATADYARMNLERMRRAGVDSGTSPDDIARTAYLGHHLGLGDAIQFMRGAIPEARARRLLVAQIGGAGAGHQIAEAGHASVAHRRWLLGYVERKVRPDRFLT